MDVLASILNDYKVCLRNAEQNILKKRDMTTGLTSTVTCLQELQQKPMAERKTIPALNTKLLSQLKQTAPVLPWQDERKSLPLSAQTI